MLQTIPSKKFGVSLALAASLLWCGFAALAQQKTKAQPEADNSRGFWPPEFRPAAPAGAKPRPGTYRPAKGTRPAPPLKPGAEPPNGLAK